MITWKIAGPGCEDHSDEGGSAMKITHHPAGAASWVDLATSDVGAARAFYSDLFGWEAQADPQAGGYAIFHKDGAAVCGAGPLMQPDQPIVWSTYFATDDADATAARARELGGSVLAEPQNAPWVRFAVLADPAGASFTASQFVADNR